MFGDYPCFPIRKIFNIIVEGKWSVLVKKWCFLLFHWIYKAIPKLISISFFLIEGSFEIKLRLLLSTWLFLGIMVQNGSRPCESPDKIIQCWTNPETARNSPNVEDLGWHVVRIGQTRIDMAGTCDSLLVFGCLELICLDMAAEVLLSSEGIHNYKTINLQTRVFVEYFRMCTFIWDMYTEMKSRIIEGIHYSQFRAEYVHLALHWLSERAMQVLRYITIASAYRVSVSQMRDLYSYKPWVSV